MKITDLALENRTLTSLLGSFSPHYALDPCYPRECSSIKKIFYVCTVHHGSQVATYGY